MAKQKPLVGVIMGSHSDWETMRHACETLDALRIPHERSVVSAHRTPTRLFKYADTARSRGIEVIIAGAGGAAHLPGMTASRTCLPVLGVPVESKSLKGLDSLLSIAQMPSGDQAQSTARSLLLPFSLGAVPMFGAHLNRGDRGKQTRCSPIPTHPSR